jgi:hypothetical protein
LDVCDIAPAGQSVASAPIILPPPGTPLNAQNTQIQNLSVIGYTPPISGITLGYGQINPGGTYTDPYGYAEMPTGAEQVVGTVFITGVGVVAVGAELALVGLVAAPAVLPVAAEVGGYFVASYTAQGLLGATTSTAGYYYYQLATSPTVTGGIQVYTILTTGADLINCSLAPNSPECQQAAYEAMTPVEFDNVQTLINEVAGP